MTALFDDIIYIINDVIGLYGAANLIDIIYELVLVDKVQYLLTPFF